MTLHSSRAALGEGAAQTHPLSPVQKQIWSHVQVGREKVYRTQSIAVRIRNSATDVAVRAAVDAVIARHGALRARFHRFAGGKIEYTLRDTDPLPIDEMDLSGESVDMRRQRLDAALKDLVESSFDIASGPAARIVLVRLSSDDVTVGFALHPIIADPQAINVLAEDFTKALAGLPLPGEARRPCAETSSGGALAHWRKVIGEETECAALPAKGRPEEALETGRSGCELEIPATLAEKVRSIASAKGSSERAVLFCVLNALLARYSGLTQFRTGLVIQGEETGEVTRREDILPVAWSIHSGLRFSDLLAQHEEAVGESLKNYVASERIVQAMLTMPGQDDTSLARTVFDFRNRAQLQEGLRAEIVLTPSPAAYGDLSVTAYPRPDGALRIALDHADGLYAPEMVRRFAGHLQTMTEAVTADPDVRLRDIELVTRQELDWLSAPYPDDAADDDRAVHLIIADHAARTPDKVAIIYGDEVWTHGELERRANRLAHRLIALGVKRETTVAIQITKSAEAVMAILAVLKAGGAYIPVEPDHPASRNHHILRDADVEVVITHARWRGRLPDDVTATVIALDEVDLSGEPETAPDVDIHPDQLAYVMYTSGSTGLPKGVAVEHGPLTHHNQATSRVYEMSSDSRELPFLPFSSDGGHERWMVPLMEGGSILLPDAPLWTPEQTLAAMRKHGVNNASIPTTYMQQLAEWADITDGAPPMRLYSFGGEGLPQTTFDLLSRSLKSGILINGYGPTETIMTPMVWKVRPGATFEGAYAPIGRAVGRRRVYVLDSEMNPCPIGVTGELYLGGEGVARGYIGKPDVTADRFVPDPFGPHGGRLYRSGDLTRWREDGTVEFVGRVDLQVKLRGYRIELGEIEAALLAQEGVSECTVLLLEEDGRKDLVGYAVPVQGAELDAATLRRGLEHRLPAYMVPSAVMVLDRMPTNPNAKLDRAALPKPGRTKREIVPPASDLERLIAEIWAEVLDLAEVGVTDSFFEIGGHSLAALKILHKLKVKRAGDRTTIADLFNHPTIRGLAAEIEKGGETTGRQVITLRSTGNRPMLYCFPGLLVSTREYLRLVDFLGPEQPATGFMCHSLSEEKTLNVSVEDVVEQYVSHIARESAGRPCAFLGWSWGGLLAYEAARMLGNRVDLRLIGMVDACDLGTDFALGAVPEFAPGEREQLQAMVDDWLSRTAMRREWDGLLGVMDELAYDQFLKFVGNEKDELPTDGPEISSREHTFWVLIDNALVFRRHRLQPHDCPIHSWTAEDSLSRGLNLMDWRQYSPRANPAEIIAGTNHLHIIGAAAFHRRFAARLDEAFSA